MNKPENLLDYGIDLSLLQKEKNSETQKWLQKHQLSSLHICVICKDLAKASQLLQQGSDINAVDWHLWTPLHHAALLRDSHMLDLLLSHGADTHLKNDYGGTYQQVLKLTTPPDERPLPPCTLFYKDSLNNKETALSAPAYQKLTKTMYLEDTYISASTLLSLWLIPPMAAKETKKDSLPEFQQWRKNLSDHTTSFLIAPASLDGSQQSVKSLGLGLFSKQTYTPFEVVGEYLGEVENSIGDYSLHAGTVNGNPFKINAQNYSNALSRINDGFPNLFLTVLSNERGLPFRPILVTLAGLSSGEQFCFNYGWHAVKKGPYVELRPQALREFIVKAEMSQWTALTAKINPLFIDQITQAEIGFMAQFRYLLQTPKALCALLLDATITSEKAKELILAAGNGHIPAEDFEACYTLVDLTGKITELNKNRLSQEMLVYAKMAVERLSIDAAVSVLRCIL